MECNSLHAAGCWSLDGHNCGNLCRLMNLFLLERLLVFVAALNGGKIGIVESRLGLSGALLRFLALECGILVLRCFLPTFCGLILTLK
jgi:hypothetical protein